MRSLPSSSEQLRMHGEISWRALEIEVISEPSIRIDLPIVATMLDPEDWNVIFEVYAGHPVLALTHAFQLIAIKQSLQRGPKGIPDAIAGLDLAIESLYPHTDFDRIGRECYHRQLKTS